MLSDSEKDALKKKFAVLVNDVELAVFTQELECQFCKETRELALGLAELSPKLKVKVYDFVKNGQCPELRYLIYFRIIHHICDKYGSTPWRNQRNMSE